MITLDKRTKTMTAFKNNFKIYFAFLGCVLFAQNAFGQNVYQPAKFTDGERLKNITATQQVVDKLFKEHAEKNHFPAMVYGIVADGKLVYSGSYGFTDVAKKIPANSTSAFRIASMSKS